MVLNGYQTCCLLCTISYKQTCLATVSYKDSSLKLFKFGQDCFVEVFIFLFSYFRAYSILEDIKHFQQAELEHYFLIIETGIWRLYFSSWSPKGNLIIFFNFEPF